MKPFRFLTVVSLSRRSVSSLTEIGFCLRPEGLPAPSLLPPDFPLTPAIFPVFDELPCGLQCVRELLQAAGIINLNRKFRELVPY